MGFWIYSLYHENSVSNFLEFSRWIIYLQRAGCPKEGEDQAMMGKPCDPSQELLLMFQVDVKGQDFIIASVKKILKLTVPSGKVQCHDIKIFSTYQQH